MCYPRYGKVFPCVPNRFQMPGLFLWIIIFVQQEMTIQLKETKFNFQHSAQDYIRNRGWSISLIGCLAMISSPCISIWYWSSEISIASSAERGQQKAPLSSLLYMSRKPSPSQSRALIRSLRLPQKRNSVFLSCGSS